VDGPRNWQEQHQFQYHLGNHRRPQRHLTLHFISIFSFPVYNSLQLARKYILYYLTAFNSKGHGMHSPFVFDFILHVLNNKSNYRPPALIEQLRQELLHDDRTLQIEDMGAGSRIHTTKEKRVLQLAATALKPKKYAQLLFRLAKHYHPQTIIELGTSLGITTSYLSVANPGARLITIEGSEAIRQVAQENFQKLGLPHIQSLRGNFDVLLPGVLQEFATVDLGYIDGNHRYVPTMNYFRQFLEKAHNDTILVFDDIHWSKEMESAWKEIQQHPSVRCTIDIFFLGFVFFRKEFKERQHFEIRF
jgi:predicted O-methyltransferase YrrM